MSNLRQRGPSEKQVESASEFIARRVEFLEDNPEAWPEMSEMPEADTSDLRTTYRLTTEGDRNENLDS